MKWNAELGKAFILLGAQKLRFGLVYDLQGEAADELPERLIGVGRCSHIQMDKAVDPFPEAQVGPKLAAANDHELMQFGSME